MTYDYDNPTGPFTWHPSGRGYGTVLGPRVEFAPGDFGYPVVHNGITLEDAIARYGDVTDAGTEIPIVVDVEN